jgi:hypothetical protein
VTFIILGLLKKISSFLDNNRYITKFIYEN